MKYAVELGSGAMIYRRSFIKIDLGIKKLVGGIHRHTDSMAVSQAYFYFFKIRKVS
jgi:hypothetical protein